MASGQYTWLVDSTHCGQYTLGYSTHTHGGQYTCSGQYTWLVDSTHG